MGSFVYGRSEALTAARWSAAANTVRAVLGVLQLAILSRLVPVSDFGLMAQATSISSALLILSDGGFSSAIIHFPQATHRELATLYWLNLLAGCALSGLLYEGSGLIASYYRAPALIAPLQVLSVLFVISAAGQQYRALAEKFLQFRALAAIEVSAAVFSVVVASTAGFLGFGVHALVAGVLANAAGVTLLCWFRWFREYAPALSFDLRSTRKFIGFGAHVVGLNFVSSLAAQGDIFVFGKLFPSNALGSYAQPRELSMRVISFINPVITRISLPVIASSQSQPQRVSRIYRGTILMSTSLAMPIYAAIATMAPEVTVTLFGPRWAGSAEYLRAAAVWCALRAVGNPITSLLLGIGMAKRALWASVVVLLLGLGTALLASLAWGPLGVPYGMAVLYAALIPGFWAFLVRPACGIDFWEYHLQIGRPLAAALFAAAATSASLQFVIGTLLRLCVGSSVFAATYLAGCLLINREWLEVMRDWVVSANVLARRRS